MQYVEIKSLPFVELNAKTIEYLYHGTSDSKLHDILKKGLVTEDKVLKIEK